MAAHPEGFERKLDSGGLVVCCGSPPYQRWETSQLPEGTCAGGPNDAPVELGGIPPGIRLAATRRLGRRYPCSDPTTYFLDSSRLSFGPLLRSGNTPGWEPGEGDPEIIGGCGQSP